MFLMFSNITFRLFLIIGSLWLVIISYQSCQPETKEVVETSSTTGIHSQFIGTSQCAGCHEGEFNLWKNSHHDLAMKEATAESVKGDFNNTEFEAQGVSSRFYKKDNRYFVETEGFDGEYGDFEITYTFGIEPLQQYLVELPGGRLQALRTAWDTENKQWFILNPDLNIHPKEWLHWTRGAMRWNTMCSNCHSTFLEKGYDPQEETFNTSWNQINVSCDGCHGPGKKHAEYVQSPSYLQGEKVEGSLLQLTSNISSEQQVDQCAPCHSRRSQITPAFEHQGKFLDNFMPEILIDRLYHADGQIQDEVYVYGSFLQSKMYHEQVKCTDCHDPHTARLKTIGNKLCMQCHEPKYDTKGHHFHTVNTEGAECINCHMTGQYYMVNDFRRDHSFRVPRPHLTTETGAPNACNRCHSDKSPQWASKVLGQWYGEKTEAHYSEILARGRSRSPQQGGELVGLIKDRDVPAIARATAIYYLGETNYLPGLETLFQALADKEPLVRLTAIRTLNPMPQDQLLLYILPLLKDSVRAVRISAANNLADVRVDQIALNYREDFEKALNEFRIYLMVNADQRTGQLMLGQYYDRSGQATKAEKAYWTALEMDSLFNPARINLGILLNQQKRNSEAVELYKTVINLEPEYGPAYYYLGLLLAEENQLEEAIPYFQQASQKMPDNSRIFYNLGLLCQNLEQPEQAEKTFIDGLKIDTESPDLHNALVILYLQQSNHSKANYHLDILLKQYPNEPQLLQWKTLIEQQNS